jgi:hypothetical protein
MTDHPIQQAVEQASGTLTYVGATGTVVWGLTSDQWTAIGVVIGIAFTVATFAINWYYRHKTWKLEYGKKMGKR